MPRTAVYPGTFDPFTNGHADIVRRALALFDKVVVALADNVRKQPLFSIAERVAMIGESLDHDPRVTIESFDGLLVDYLKGRKARIVVRGLRALADFEYEFQLAHMNRHLFPEIETVFLPTNEDSFYVSSSLVKEVASMGGDVSRIVPPPVARALAARLGQPGKRSA